MWRLNFYQEMVAIKLHRYFPYDSDSKSLTAIAEKKLAKIKMDGTSAEKERVIDKDLEDRMLAKSYLVRCLTPETVQSLEATEKAGESGSLWLALMNQCQSQHKHTLRDVHQQLINIKMSTTESLVAYQGRAQQLTKRLANTSYSVPDAHKWGIFTNGLLDVYRT